METSGSVLLVTLITPDKCTFPLCAISLFLPLPIPSHKPTLCTLFLIRKPQDYPNVGMPLIRTPTIGRVVFKLLGSCMMKWANWWRARIIWCNRTDLIFPMMRNRFMGYLRSWHSKKGFLSGRYWKNSMQHFPKQNL